MNYVKLCRSHFSIMQLSEKFSLKGKATGSKNHTSEKTRDQQEQQM